MNHNRHNTKEKIIIALAAYAIAMALVEAAVVIYLRELYYPAGFFIKTAADLQIIPWKILRVEVWREVATIIMLLAVSFLAFSRVKEKIWALAPTPSQEPPEFIAGIKGRLVNFLRDLIRNRKVWGFVLAFSVWDLFYYFFLYVFLRWPPSLGTIDVYFLIPRPLIGPVWIPLVLFSILAVGSLWYLLRSSPKN